MESKNQPEEELKFFSFAEVGSCEQVFEKSQTNAAAAVTKESAVSRLTNTILKKSSAQSLSAQNPLKVTSICA